MAPSENQAATQRDAGGSSPYRIGDSLEVLKINSEMKIVEDSE